MDQTNFYVVSRNSGIHPVVKEIVPQKPFVILGYDHSISGTILTPGVISTIKGDISLKIFPSLDDNNTIAAKLAILESYASKKTEHTYRGIIDPSCAPDIEFHAFDLKRFTEGIEASEISASCPKNDLHRLASVLRKVSYISAMPCATRGDYLTIRSLEGNVQIEIFDPYTSVQIHKEGKTEAIHSNTLAQKMKELAEKENPTEDDREELKSKVKRICVKLGKGSTNVVAWDLIE